MDARFRDACVETMQAPRYKALPVFERRGVDLGTKMMTVIGLQQLIVHV